MPGHLQVLLVVLAIHAHPVTDAFIISEAATATIGRSARVFRATTFLVIDAAIPANFVTGRCISHSHNGAGKRTC